MSDPVESFENILKNQYTKSAFSLYGENNAANEQTYKPQDVILSVSSQLKAIHFADTIIKQNKSGTNFKQCTFLSVNKLPVYVQEPIQQTRFYTQNVTDSQLMNMIETAEILEAHQGMTQEFDTAFIHTNTDNYDQVVNHSKHNYNVVSNNKADSSKAHVSKYIDGISIGIPNHDTEEFNKSMDRANSNTVTEPSQTHKKNIDNYINIKDINKHINVDLINITQDVKINNSQILKLKNEKKKRKNNNNETKIISNIQQNVINTNNNSKEDPNVNDNETKEINDGMHINNAFIAGRNSTICCKDAAYYKHNKKISDKGIVLEPLQNLGDLEIQINPRLNMKNTHETIIMNEEYSPNVHSSIRDEYKQNEEDYAVINKCIKISDLDEKNRPQSPILGETNIKKPILNVPLVFNLDKFETFENIAIPLIETNDFETAKRVINSQILNKELHFNMNDSIVVKNRECFKSATSVFTTSEELMQIPDKTKFKGICKQFSNRNPNINKDKNESFVAFFEDNILYSSGEDDVNRNDQDLPHTCALKTSLYDQTEVLNKSMYVGFQTANNRSIQVCATSFQRAKNLLTDIVDDGVTVTELVKNSNPIQDIEQQSTNPNKENIKICCFENNNDETVVNDVAYNSQILNTEIEHDRKLTRIENIIPFGFKTANNKKIIMSEASYARCKKVFQDIDISEDFDCYEEERYGNKGFNCKNSNHIADNFENVDDVIIQDFENTKMFLGYNEKKKVNISSKLLNNDNTRILNDKLNKIAFEDDEMDGMTIKENILSQIVSGSRNKSYISEINRNGLKSTSTNVINYSENVCADFKSTSNNVTFGTPDNCLQNSQIFQPYFEQLTKRKSDLAIQENFNVNNKAINLIMEKFEKNMRNLDTKEHSASKTFVGFKTASSKDIKISTKAWSKTKNIFDDINLIKLPNERNKHNARTNLVNNNKSDGNFNIYTDSNSIGIGNPNKSHDFEAKIPIIANTFHCNNLKDISLPADDEDTTKKNNTVTNSHKSQIDKNESISLYSKGERNIPNVAFCGFKTANNKIIKVSKESLVKSKNIFNDIDIIDKKIPMNNPNIQPDLRRKNVVNYTVNDDIQCNGFKTASNKIIRVSDAVLTKTKNIFKDIDSIDFKMPSNNKKEYPDTEPNVEESKSSNIVETNNSLVKIPSEELHKNRDEIDYFVKSFPKYDTLETRPTSPVFQGFQAGNKKALDISAMCLRKSRDLFSGLDDKKSQVQPESKQFCGFQTASNKEVKISEKALADSRKFLNEIYNNTDSEKTNARVKPLYPKEILQPDDEEDNKISNINSREIKSVSKNQHITIQKAVDVCPKTRILCRIQKEENEINDVALENKTEMKAPIKFNRNKVHGFKGIQTAGAKNVIVSEQALAKAKDIFNDINSRETQVSDRFCFLTANNKSTKVSEEAIIKSKRLFSEIDDEEIISKKDKKDSLDNAHDETIDGLIDTQVINDFDEALNTEDFRNTPLKSKRSGSPILSCPRNKKRKKFATPYNLKNISKPVLKTDNIINQEANLIYRHDYKKNKKIKLKDLNEMSKDLYTTTDQYIFKYNYDNLLQFEFVNDRNDLSEGNMDMDLLKEYFLKSINVKLVPNGWIDNHIKLILWKLISYEVKFKFKLCTAKNVLEQLSYRYKRELYDAERPALRKIMEKDDIPSKTLVLCVVEIYVDGLKVSSVTNGSSNIELLVTDGWYCIRCTIDKMLAELVGSHKILVGTKFVTSGAELLGCEQGVSPWEEISAVRLKIFGNSTRRARWDARLGYYGNGAILSQLSSVKVLGGKVTKLRLFVTRVYPALYVEKFDDGSTVTRSERLENLHQMKAEADRQAYMEKICEEIEKEFADREFEDSEGLSESCRITCLESGSQIAKMMKRSRDPSAFIAQLTNTQTRLLEDHTSRSRERFAQEMQTRVRERLEKCDVCVTRNVISLLKIRIAGLREKGDNVVITKGMMSIWKPNDAVREMIKEGIWIDVINVVPTAIRYGEIQISAGRQSVFSKAKYNPPGKFQPYINLLQRKCYTIKDLTKNPNISTDFNEIDTVGLIFLIEPSNHSFDSTKQSFQNVYMSDADCNIICVYFWGGLKKYGFQNILDTGQIVCCVNLQKRAGNTRKSIPHYRVTEFSYFTQTPRCENAKKISDELNKKVSSLDRRKFCETCVALKNYCSVVKYNNENVSPYRYINNSDVNMSANRMFIDSPLAGQSLQKDFNFSGLDFESTFKQDTELSEDALKRKRKINEKIAKLKMYGEPPPLSHINIINKSKQASSSYKSPLLTNQNNRNICNITPKYIKRKHSIENIDGQSESSENVTNLKNTPDKCGKVRNSVTSNSPVLLNRTYIKRINPIKINFDVQNNNDSNIDPFAEEFDA